MQRIRDLENIVARQRRSPRPGLLLSPLAPLLCAWFLSCGSGGAGPEAEQCGPFSAWDSSPYLFPYPVGHAYRVNQANCSGQGHRGFWKHGYDFAMPIGASVTASRGGTVGWARDGCADGVVSCTNLVTILHPDGMVSVYSHLTRGGVAVTEGQVVSTGDTIGRSGNSGNTGGFPHLHFSLHPCNELPGLPNPGDCPSLPLAFRNTDPNPNGLRQGVTYLAGP